MKKNGRALESIRKEQIFEGALKVISENGTKNVTLDLVAKASGLSKGGVTYYYSSKDELFKGVFEFLFENFFREFELMLQERDDPYEKLLVFTWLYTVEDQTLLLGYPLFFECMSLANFDEEYREIFHVWLSRWVRMVTGVLQECVEQKGLKIDDIDSTARIIGAISQGIASRWYLDRKGHTTEWALAAYERAVGALLNIEFDKDVSHSM
ncbi:TetR/AcrR family transcriptional regulator [bacterium]|nr:TetR/AcrR family transcriptional regulator [bacterium]